MSGKNNKIASENMSMNFSKGWGIILYQALMFFLLIGFSIDGLNIVAPAFSESSGVDYAAEHGPGPYVPRIVEQYIKEFGHSPLEDFPEWEPVHEILLGNNVMGIENIGGDVEKVKGQRFTFCAFPLRWYMGDGTIVRAVAFIDEDKINKDVPDRVYKYGVY